mgnify:CR=1 FL=1
MIMDEVVEKCKKHKQLILMIFLLGVFCYYLIWTISQPFDTCPDEKMKWDICKYISEHNSIPDGRDESIRNPMWGISYAFQPILTYMIGAVFVKIASIFTTNQFVLVVSARLVSTISMTLVIYFVIKIADKLFKDKGKYKYLFITIIAFQPITAFLASYINNDSTAILAITMIIYLWILGLESNWKTKYCVLLGLAIGFCTLTYYNAYGYILCSVIICMISTISNKVKVKDITQKAIIVSLVAFAVAGWWFVRNAIIYDGDILGTKTQNEYGDKYAMEEYKPSTRETPQNKGESLWHMLYNDKWLNVIAKSFIGMFGYQKIIMSNKIYYSYFLIWLIGGIGCILKFKELFIYKNEERNKYLLNYIFVISIIIPIALSIIYSYTSDFQPQGRYIMGIIVPFTYFLVSGIEEVLEKFVKSQKIKNTIILMLITLIIIISFKAIFAYVIPTYKKL